MGEWCIRQKNKLFYKESKSRVVFLLKIYENISLPKFNLEMKGYCLINVSLQRYSEHNTFFTFIELISRIIVRIKRKIKVF